MEIIDLIKVLNELPKHIDIWNLQFGKVFLIQSLYSNNILIFNFKYDLNTTIDQGYKYNNIRLIKVKNFEDVKRRIKKICAALRMSGYPQEFELKDIIKTKKLIVFL